jgi:hypothetical protein
LRLGWGERSAVYSAAADRHARLKDEYRNYVHGPRHSTTQTAELRRKYQAASAIGPAIPEKDFLRLKQKHLRKVRLSQMLDESPGTPMWLLKWRLFREGIRNGEQQP